MCGSQEKIKTELVKRHKFGLSNSYNEDGECHRKCRRNVIENVIEILRKIKLLKSEYSKKKLSKE